jgi:hypothetical protein
METKPMIHYLIDLVGHVSEMSEQGRTPTKQVCFPGSLCELCLHLGTDPWNLLAVYRKANKPKSKRAKGKR